MKTKFVGLKELRQNMAKITGDAHKNGERVIVLKKNQPLFELRPLTGTDVLLAEFDHQLAAARASAKKGNVHSTKEVRKLLGIKPYEV